ncbi:MAG: ABC transporter permease, partial [Hyphomicrobiales bacterium]
MIHLFRVYGTLIGFVSICLFFSVQLPETFLTARNLINITQQISMLAVVAFSMTLVMVMNDFDLSVGSMASLAGVVAAVLFSLGYPIYVGIAVALLVGVVGGVFNGVLVSIFGILPFVATLGTLTMFSGIAFLTSGGKTIFGRDIPSDFSGFARGGIPLDTVGLEGLKLPFLSLLAMSVLGLVWFILEHTTFGRRLYAIGGNYEAAR